MKTDESAESRGNLGGVTVPFVETCPALSVLEVFDLEGTGRPVWCEETEDDAWPERTVRLFVCLVVDALYRDCQFSSVTNLWEVLVASDPQVLIGTNSGLNDVMVIHLNFESFVMV